MDESFSESESGKRKTWAAEDEVLLPLVSGPGESRTKTDEAIDDSDALDTPALATASMRGEGSVADGVSCEAVGCMPTTAIAADPPTPAPTDACVVAAAEFF